MRLQFHKKKEKIKRSVKAFEENKSNLKIYNGVGRMHKFSRRQLSGKCSHYDQFKSF